LIGDGDNARFYAVLLRNKRCSVLVLLRYASFRRGRRFAGDGCRQGCQIGHIMANFEKFGQFLTALAMKMKERIWPFCKIWPFLVIFSVCQCKIKFFIKYFVFLYFLDGLNVTHCYSNTVALQPFIALKCVVMI